MNGADCSERRIFLRLDVRSTRKVAVVRRVSIYRSVLLFDAISKVNVLCMMPFFLIVLASII